MQLVQRHFDFVTPVKAIRSFLEAGSEQSSPYVVPWSAWAPYARAFEVRPGERHADGAAARIFK